MPRLSRLSLSATGLDQGAVLTSPAAMTAVPWEYFGVGKF